MLAFQSRCYGRPAAVTLVPSVAASAQLAAAGTGAGATANTTYQTVYLAMGRSSR